MNIQTRFHSLFYSLAPAGVVLVVSALLVSAPACGASVATCASICALPDAPTTCETTCTETQTTCAATGDACSSDFQLFLTCVENTQTYASIGGLCSAPAKAVSVSITSFGDAGTGTDAHTVTCASATCASVCANSGSATEVASCTSSCQSTQADCPMAAEAFQSLLTCLCDAGGANMGIGTSATAECATIAVDLDQSCPGLFQQVDAG